MEQIWNNCRVENHFIYPPTDRLAASEYAELKKVLTKNGGKWVGGKTQAFLFTKDPTDILTRLQGGEKVDDKKKFQAYFTPPDICDMVVEMAEIEAHHKVLEPSAGSGNMLEAIKRIFPNPPHESPYIEYCELQEENSNIIHYTNNSNAHKIFNTFVPDFMDLPIEKEYDVIVANPPFNKNQDIKHLTKMISHLKKPGGCVVCITSVGWLTNSTKICVDFRKLIGIEEHYPLGNLRYFENIGDTGEYATDNFFVHLRMLPSDTFKESGANVRTLIIKIVKNG